MAAQSLGYKVAVLDPGDHSPAGSVADRHIRADYLDPGGLAALAALVAAATTEFENVPAAALDVPRPDRARGAGRGERRDRAGPDQRKEFPCPLRPRGRAVCRARGDGDAREADAALLPGIVKSARLGYDGKGQLRVATRDEAVPRSPRWAASLRPRKAADARAGDLGGRRPQRARRDRDLAGRREPPSRRHPRRLHRPGARSAMKLAGAALATATAVAAALDYRGVLCVEMFVTRDGQLLVNEIAPRPHNSGHYTIDACVTSQFEQQARVLAGLPLGDTRQHAAGGDGQPAGRHLVRRRRGRRPARARLDARAAAPAGEAASLRQGRARGAGARWAT